MCGICGFYSRGQPAQAMALQEATRSLAHRGPDGMMTWLDESGTVGLGHTRLAIIDLKTGQQPMCSIDGRFVIVFNGEIYNFRELREELESLGHIFRTDSDTEVLLNAYREWDKECLLRLSGMFAFAIFDAKSRKLFLSRDRTGIKPLYYHHGTSGFVFGSELKALLAWPEVPRRVDRKAIIDFLMIGYPLPPATCFRDCRELEPGCYLEIREDQLRSSRYWSWKRTERKPNGTDPLRNLEEELGLAVREHMVSDVPVGAFLSGGLDSSLMVALQAINGGQRLHTFNVKFGEADYDESVYARAVAAHVGTEHHEIELETNKGDLAMVAEVLDQFDQPFGDSSAIPMYSMCREIRKYVKVVIGGDGGDEMFGGYPRFAHADVIQIIGRMPQWTLRAVEAGLRFVRVPSRDSRRQGLRLIRVAQRLGKERFVALCSILPAVDLPNVLQPEFSSLVGGYLPSFPLPSGRRNPGGPELIDATMVTALPGDYLRKVDVMSSAHGLEVRVPMLSNRILEFAERLPNRLKYNWRRNKILLRRLAKKYLPAEIANKRKQGFGIPLDSWLGSEGRLWLSAVLSDSGARVREIVRPEYIDSMMSGFADGNWDRSRLSRFSLYQRAYALWSLERWLRKWRPAL